MSFCHSSHCHADDCLCAMKPRDQEVRRLTRSDAACDLADIWAAMPTASLSEELVQAMNRLEELTRGSPLRKVRP